MFFDRVTPVLNDLRLRGTKKSILKIEINVVCCEGRVEIEIEI